MHEKFQGYPSQDTVLNLETATPSQIANALSRMSHIATVGDDWEFLNPQDTCTVHVIDTTTKSYHPLDLRSATFSIHRDAQTQRYYTAVRHADAVVQDGPQPLRLFEGDTYHDVFFAEGYLQALAQKCHKSHLLHAQNNAPSSS